MEVNGNCSKHPIVLIWTTDPAFHILHSIVDDKECDSGARVLRLDSGLLFTTSVNLANKHKPCAPYFPQM